MVGVRLEWVPVGLAVLLAACGVALGRRAGGAVVALSVGLAAAVVAGGPGPLERADPGRPVEVVGRVAEHPRWDGETWSARVSVRKVVQRRRGAGRNVELGRDELWLTLPGPAPPPGLGSRVRVRGRLSRSPGFANALPVAPGPWRLWLKSRRLMTVEADPGPLAALAGRWRRRVETALAAQAERRAAPSAGLALTRALVLGDPGEVPERWRRGLRRAGLAHLLAVSGLHVGLVAATVFLLAFPLPWKLRLALALTAVLVYLLVAGPRPSLLRATMMVLLATLALLAGRPPLAGNALAVAAAVLVLHRPALVDDLGFRLTVAATAGLLFLAPPAAGAGRRAVDAVRERLEDHRRAAPLRTAAGLLRTALTPLAASLGAQVGSLPFAAPAFHMLSFLAPLTNLVAVPVTALLLVAAGLWTGLALLAPDAAARGLPLLDAAAGLFALPAAGRPAAWGTLTLVAPAGVSLLVAGLLAVALLRPGRRAAWLLLPLALLWPAWKWGDRPPPARRGVELTMLDVGQGDALLLRDGRRAVLVDGGGWRRGDLGGRVLLPALLGEAVDRLDAVVLTHPDRDHCRGLVDLASYLPVGELWTAPGWPREPCGAALTAAVTAGDTARLRLLTAGSRAGVGRWHFTVLHPAAGSPPRRRNDGSLVLRAAALGRRVLLTGDVEAAAEDALLRRWPRPALAADVLKVAHHGSRTSSTPRLLRAVSPRLAVVSAGVGNPYHHPSPVVVERLERAGVLVLATNERGAVRLTWGRDGRTRWWWPGR